MIDFVALKKIYNNQIDMMLSPSGLATECVLNFGISKKHICPNCVFDVNLKKSANKYKSGGPIQFETGSLCPYCNGVGYYGKLNNKIIFLTIIWDYKKWINPPPPGVAIPDGMIQTMCDISLLSDIKKSQSLEIKYPSASNTYPKFKLYSEPNPAGLGDNHYLICLWSKIN